VLHGPQRRAGPNAAAPGGNGGGRRSRLTGMNSITVNDGEPLERDRGTSGRGRGMPALLAPCDEHDEVDRCQQCCVLAGCPPLEIDFPVGPGARAELDHAMSTVGRLHRAGLRLLAGTDASSPGTAHGASLHDDLQLLVQTGLPSVAALAAATSVPAAAFGLTDRGAPTPGMRADLVLIDGDPEPDITRARHIAQVWRAGRRVTTRT
jgi:hypothetical protein